MDETDKRKVAIEREIAKEKSKYPLLTVEQVKLFLNRFTKGDIKDFFFREKLVETFIQKIVADNDKITIWYTVQDGYFAEYPVKHPVCISPDLAGAVGIEPTTYGFGDRRSTS